MFKHFQVVYPSGYFTINFELIISFKSDHINVVSGPSLTIGFANVLHERFSASCKIDRHVHVYNLGDRRCLCVSRSRPIIE